MATSDCLQLIGNSTKQIFVWGTNLDAFLKSYQCAIPWIMSSFCPVCLFCLNPHVGRKADAIRQYSVYGGAREAGVNVSLHGLIYCMSDLNF